MAEIRMTYSNTIEGSTREFPYMLIRHLTPGEIAMAQPLFKDSIVYSDVIIHEEGMRDGTITTPRGNMYLGEILYNQFKDFSKEKDASNKVWFMHEMAHVWQYKLGYNVALHGLTGGLTLGYVRGKIYDYEKETDVGKTELHEFNFEQQAEIISHYFGAAILQMNQHLPRLKLLEGVLKEFLREPKNKMLLPRNEVKNPVNITE